MTTGSTADDGFGTSGGDWLPGVKEALQRLVDAGLGPTIGLRADWRRRSAIERITRLGPEELNRQLDVLYREHHDDLVRYAAKVLGQHEGAEDVVNEAFIRVLQADPDLDAPDNLPSYLRAAIRNKARDHGSKTSRDQARRRPEDIADLEGRLASPDRPVADRVCDEITVALVVPLLTERQRQCFMLRVLDGLSVKEIATKLEISEGNVKRLCYEVRARLAAALDVP